MQRWQVELIFKNGEVRFETFLANTLHAALWLARMKYGAELEKIDRIGHG